MRILVLGVLVVAGTMTRMDGAAQSAAPPAPNQAVKLTWPQTPSSRSFRLAGALAPADAARLRKPFGIAVDPAGRIFIADPGLKGVLVVDRQTGASACWQGNDRFPLLGPVAVALDRKGRLFAVDGYRSRVVVFDNSGAPVAAFGQDVLKRPEGIAVDPRAGRVYIGDVKLHQVLAFDLQTFELRQTIGSEPERYFTSPAGVAVNSKGQLLVSDGWNCRVQLFDAEGKLVRRFPTQCANRAEAGRPHTIAVDARDRIYVSDPDDYSLQIFDPSGKPLQFVAVLGEHAKPPLLRTGMAIDSDARIYVVEQQEGQGRLQIFVPPGGARRRAQTAQSTPGPRP